MSTSRLETFADGVFAIAATLLILDVSAHGPDLGHSLVHIWPSYVGYAVSFLTIGVMWVNHHTVFGQIDRVDRRFLFINVGLLMCIAFVPFPTRLVALHIRDEGAKAATLAYGLTLTITAIFFYLLWFVGVLRGGLLKSEADPSLVSGISEATGREHCCTWAQRSWPSPAPRRARRCTPRSPSSTSSRARCSRASEALTWMR